MSHNDLDRTVTPVWLGCLMLGSMFGIGVALGTLVVLLVS